ncbi:hypothetical protein RND71_009167 [Anisodus tanguticus]|uniref:F-box domain-containing protein n=1 Tax=Anisodus tanguticus TaxID=243964 RepID=A0AAE1SHR9_9SOLA|nr:hypothetical protein RND71_009167 [Anisodus tanguticus]
MTIEKKFNGHEKILTNREQLDIDRAIHFKEEIIMEILSRLPVQSLLRFKCVSKFWEALISDPYFKMKHLNCAKNRQDSKKLLINQIFPEDGIVSIYCCPLSSLQLVQDVQKLDCPLNPKSTRFAIHCCYDGVVVIGVRDNLNGYRHTLLLWNPSTRESIVLPAPEFPPNEGSHFGMGYDSTSGEYKILHMRRDLRRSIPSEILALKGGSWRRIDKHFRGFFNALFAMQFLAFVHAAFHWVGLSRERFANGEVLFLCKILKSFGRAFKTPSGPYVSWPQCETLQDGYAFTESFISPKSLISFLWERVVKPSNNTKLMDVVDQVLTQLLVTITTVRSTRTCKAIVTSRIRIAMRRTYRDQDLVEVSIVLRMDSTWKIV